MSFARMHRLALGALAFVSAFAASRAALATSTKLTMDFEAAAYTVAATGTFPSLAVPGRIAAVAGPGPFTMPDVSPGHAVTLVVVVNDAGSGAAITTGSITISDGTTKLVTAAVKPITYMRPGTSMTQIGTKASGYGVSFTLHLSKGVHSLSAAYEDTQGLSRSSLYAQATSVPHTAEDLDCHCYAGGAVLASCVQANQPKTPVGETLVCKSHVAAETFDSAHTTAYWGAGPAGNASFDMSGMGIFSATVTDPDTTKALATKNLTVPSQVGSYTIGASFQATKSLDGLTSSGPKVTVNVVAAQ